MATARHCPLGKVMWKTSYSKAISLACAYYPCKHSTGENGWVLDPFAGSSTTGIAANLVGRRYLGIERERPFSEISRNRRIEIDNFKVYSSYKSKIKDIAKMELFEPKSYFFKEDFINDLPF